MSKMEQKLGKYAIPNIVLLLIICYAFGYAIQAVNYTFLDYLYLNPYLILKGQVWRLVSWILVPPSDFNLFTIIMLFFYYSIGQTLERTWGAFRLNLYLFSGMIFTLIGAFVLLGYFYVIGAEAVALIGADQFFALPNVLYCFSLFSTYYVNMSIFLAFAMTFPDVEVLLMFVIPVKIKWLGIIYAVMLAFNLFSSGVAGRIVMGASLLNAFIFFLATRNVFRISPRQMQYRYNFRKAVKRSDNTGMPRHGGSGPITRHKCAICGRTENDGNLEFRFCSKCDGNYEYCQDHLFTHQHIKKN